MLDGGICAHEAENPVGLVGIRGPDFLAIDQVMVALVFAFGLQVSQIRAGARFGIPLTPARFAHYDVRQEALLLLFIAKFEQGRPEHPQSEGIERRPRFDAAQFLLQDASLRAA